MSNSKFSDHVCNWGHTVPEKKKCIHFILHSAPATLVYSNEFCRLFSHLLHESSIHLRPRQTTQHIRDSSPVRDSITFPSILSVFHLGTQPQTEYRSGMIESFSGYLTTIFLPHNTRSTTSLPYFTTSFKRTYYRDGSGNLTHEIRVLHNPRTKNNIQSTAGRKYINLLRNLYGRCQHS